MKQLKKIFILISIILSTLVQASPCNRVQENLAEKLSSKDAILYTRKSIIYECTGTGSDLIQISEKPLIYIVPEVLSNNDIDLVLNLAKNRLKPSKVGAANVGTVSKIRTSHSAYFEPELRNTDLKEIYHKLGDTVGIPSSHIENLQAVNYQPGQEYRAHYDYGYDINSARQDWLHGGIRIATLFVYLNSLPFNEQAFTRFPLIDVAVKPTKNMGVLWFGPGSHDENYDLTMHAGLPPLSKEKWGLNVWFHTKKYKPMNKHMAKIFNKTSDFVLRYAPHELIEKYLLPRHHDVNQYQG